MRSFFNNLNLSFHDFEGEIPTKKVLGNISQIILVGNSKMCGRMPELKLPSCPLPGKRKGKPVIVIVISTVFTLILISVTLISFLIVSF